MQLNCMRVKHKPFSWVTLILIVKRGVEDPGPLGFIVIAIYMPVFPFDTSDTVCPVIFPGPDCLSMQPSELEIKDILWSIPPGQGICAGIKSIFM